MCSEFEMQKKGVNEKKFSKCIYCGSMERLSDEHALARAFSGFHILRNASCRKCAEITSKFEGKILRGALADYRYFKGYKSRSKHKTLKVTKKIVIKNDKGVESIKDFDLDTIGSCLFIPEFNEPTLEYKKDEMKVKDVHYITMKKNNRDLPLDVKEVLFTQNFPMQEYLRFLAKIAYCYTCLTYNPDEIEVFILPVILSEKDQENLHYIGTPKEHLFTDNDKAAIIFNSNGIISCHLKLFNESPVVYEVIVGKIINMTKE